MKKETQLLGLTMLTLLFVSLFIGCIGEKKEEKEQAEYLESLPEDWKIYENKKWGIKFKYPSKWEFEEGPVGGVDGVGVFKWVGVKKDIQIYLCVSFMEDPYPNLSTYEESKKLLKEIEEYSDDFTCLELTNITLDGVPATKCVVSYSEYKITRRDYDYEIVIVAKKEGKYYGFLYGASSEEIENAAKYFKEYLPIANEMINSFRFL
jgi:hypothetical protein